MMMMTMGKKMKVGRMDGRMNLKACEAAPRHRRSRWAGPGQAVSSPDSWSSMSPTPSCCETTIRYPSYPYSFISTIEMETTSHLLSTNTIDRSSQLPKLRDHDYSATPHRTREDNKNTGRNNENKRDAGFKSSLFADFLFEERMTIVPDLVQRVMQEPTMSHHNDFLLFSRPQPVQGKKCQQTHSGNLIITRGYLIFEIFSTKGSSKDSTS